MLTEAWFYKIIRKYSRRYWRSSTIKDNGHIRNLLRNRQESQYSKIRNILRSHYRWGNFTQNSINSKKPSVLGKVLSFLFKKLLRNLVHIVRFQETFTVLGQFLGFLQQYAQMSPDSYHRREVLCKYKTKLITTFLHLLITGIHHL